MITRPHSFPADKPVFELCGTYRIRTMSYLRAKRWHVGLPRFGLWKRRSLLRSRLQRLSAPNNIASSCCLIFIYVGQYGAQRIAGEWWISSNQVSQLMVDCRQSFLFDTTTSSNQRTTRTNTTLVDASRQPGFVRCFDA
jgi:hypothetical protein